MDASPLDKLLLLIGYIRRLDDRHQGFAKQEWAAVAAECKQTEGVYPSFLSLRTMKLLKNVLFDGAQYTYKLYQYRISSVLILILF